MNKLQRTQHTSRYELLSTKLTPPYLRSALLQRQRLLERLKEGLEHKLTLLSAPAGFGKTTLVCEWVAAGSEQQDGPPIAWVSLDAGDNDPVRFWRYVITACQAFQTNIGTSALAVLQTSQQPSFETSQQASFETMLTTFINELDQLVGKNVLVLEDYHVITSRQVHDSLAFLLDHLPPTLHLVMITRNDPPLPLARLRARNELSELHAADLRFSAEETQSFLEQTIPFPLPDEAITRLAERTEGWIAGLRLVALALQGRQDPQEIEQFLTTFSGSHRHILEYLAAEVLYAQPEPLQEFLLQTTFLSRLTGSLCDAVTGRNDSESMLEQLERANLFLVPLDGAGQWYRYHALFAEAMQHEARRRLGETSLHSLSNKASLWYEQHGFITEAVESALSAQAFTRAATLIERFIEPQSLSSELHTLRRWMEQISEEILRAHPALCFNYAIVLLFTSDRSAPATRDLVSAPLEMAERSWRAEGNRHKLGEVLAFRSMVAMWQRDLQQMSSAARQALELLPEHETYWRGNSMLNLSSERLFSGKIDDARQVILEARALCEASQNGYGTRAATFMLGEVCTRQAALHQSAQLYQQILAESGDDLIDRASALIALAALSYEWNDLEAAEQQVSEAFDIGKQQTDDMGKQYLEESLLIPGSLILARMKHAQGETAQAQQLLHTLVTLAQQRRWARLLREVLACQAQLRLSAGDLAAVQRWSTTIARQADDIPLVQQEREALIVARMLIAQGETEAALNLLEHWQAEAHEDGRTASELEMMMLRALAHSMQKDLSHAKPAIIQALLLAQPQGYMRLFLEEGKAMDALLRTVLLEVREEPLVTYIWSLLHAFSQERAEQDADATPSSPRTAPVPLLEPLSPQEQRVLRLLAAGLSNPEMARELVVSVNTIKTQVQSIYRKLNVKDRWEARERARHLKLS